MRAMSGLKQLVPYAVGAAAMLITMVGLGAMVRTATAASDGEQNAAFIRPVYKQFTVLPGQVEQAFARCPQGQVAIAGGYEAQAGSYMYITASAPTRAKGGWEVQALVPNKIESPSALPAKILIVAWCVPSGRPVVASVVP